jgi:16S rRNA processing protein RimM
MTKRERPNQRSTPARPDGDTGGRGGVGVQPIKTAPASPSSPLSRKGAAFQKGSAFQKEAAVQKAPAPLDPAFADLVLVGEFGRAHGLKGEVRLKSYTADPQAIADYHPLMTDNGRSVSLKSVRPAPGSTPDLLIAQVQGVTTREAAEALNRVRLSLSRDKLPAPEEEDEFLLADLIGLPVQDEAGERLGTIVDMPNYGGGDLLEIAPAEKGPTAFLPFTRAFVPVVDIAAKRVVIAPPEDFFAPAKPEPEPDTTDEDEA